MNIRDINDVCIVDMTKDVISQTDVQKLRKLYKKTNGSKRIGINLSNINSIDYDFLEFIQETSIKDKLSAFNVNSDIYLQLFVLKKDTNINLYLDEYDFCNNRRTIVNRKLKLLKTA